jgi:hypothetical protein
LSVWRVIVRCLGTASSPTLRRNVRVFRAQKAIEGVEPVCPEALVERKLLHRPLQRRRLEMADMGAPADLAANEAGLLEYADVLRCRRQRHRKRSGQFSDASLAVGEDAQHLPTGCVAQCMKDLVHRNPSFSRVVY